jgi:phosphoglycolate phosphatase
MKKRLFLFDIDGTLIFAGGCPRTYFSRIFQELFQEDLYFIAKDFLGRTDSFIIQKALKKLGYYHRPDLEELIIRRFIALMNDEYLRCPDGYRVPGIGNFLDWCSQQDDLYLGLITGNLRPTAFIKLEKFGLDVYFETGGFGDDSIDRNELSKLAVQRAEKLYNSRFFPEDIYIFGDTPHDVACAHAWNFQCIGVASTESRVRPLAEAQPQWIIRDFNDAGLFDFLNISSRQ